MASILKECTHRNDKKATKGAQLATLFAMLAKGQRQGPQKMTK
jgi:hypothetical protein